LTAIADCHQCEVKGEAVGNLLYWAVVFLVVAVVAAVLGFGGVTGTAMAGAQLLFWVAIVLLSSPWSPASFGAGFRMAQCASRRQLPPALSCTKRGEMRLDGATRSFLPCFWTVELL
jgi:uncharacterized membrane protein YtjA (UPF0391 family)